MQSFGSFEVLLVWHDNICANWALQVYYVVDKPSGFFWKGGVGYITEDMVRQHLPPPSNDSLILVRG